MLQEKLTAEQERVRGVYQKIAEEYDERIPGHTENDKIFTSTEMKFLREKISSTDHVLDIGCGTGRFTIPLARLAQRVAGLDLSDAMLLQARAKAKQENVEIDFYEANMAHMPLPDHSFDVVVSMLALMHIPLEKRQQVFFEISRVLKPGGRLIVSVKNAIFERFSKADRFADVDVTDVDKKELIFTNTRSGAEMKAPWYSFSPQDLEKLCATAQLHITHLRGITPLSAWMTDTVLADPKLRTTIDAFEHALGDVPPFNYLGYHLLIEAIKPA